MPVALYCTLSIHAASLMRISVIIPCYNHSDLLHRCVMSVLDNGAVEGEEVIVVDDGSEGGVGCMEQSLAEAAKNRHIPLRFLGQPHKGASAARNYGLERAEGDYIWFVDADDTIEKGALSVLLTRIVSECDMVRMGNMRRASDGKVVGKSSLFDHTTYLYRRQFLRERQLRYPEEMRILEDSMFVLRCLQHRPRILDITDCRFYLLGDRHSSTTGAWNAARSARFVPDILRFFLAFRRLADAEDGEPLSLRVHYDRYFYVYLRVLAVKGCPWHLLERFRNEARAPQFYYTSSPTFPMRLLRCKSVHQFLALFCRVFRRLC